MQVLIFGATGMVGQGVLRECLLDPGVTRVVAIGRSATGVTNPKLRDLVHKDMHEYASIERELAGFDACFFCLGITSAGMSEADYTRITYDITVAAAETLARLNPGMTFIFVSGAGTDSSERGRLMWARVKGRAENAVLRLFEAGYAFRPGIIQPMHGIRSRTLAYNIVYTVLAPMVSLLRYLLPRYVITTEEMGRAMLNVARHGAPTRILENPAIHAAARDRGTHS
jgi:uncharacterized protein YbjT (DUF2867 family)